MSQPLPSARAPGMAGALGKSSTPVPAPLLSARQDAGVLIEAVALAKRYGTHDALREVSLSVRRGEIYGFLGRNGAGKSTTIRILLGLVRPTRGEVRLFGERMVPGRQDLCRRIGVVLEQPGFYPNLTAFENLTLEARAFGLPQARRDPVDAALSLVGMDSMARHLVKSFSQGERQRLALARALLHEPELLILDEPTNGLDPYAIRDVRELLLRLARERGVTIFLSSHILTEVQKLCTRIGIVHQGRVVEEIGLTELRRRSRRYLELEVTDCPRATWVLENELGITDFLAVSSSTLHVYDAPDPALIQERPEAVTGALVRNGIGVRRMAFGQDSLEEHFVRLTEGSTHDDVAGLR